jgi:putative ABC transport system ATP-binding protein
MNNPDCFLCIENLSKSYLEGKQNRSILSHASSIFPKGEFTAVVGKSGSGKSTLLNLISGIDLADDGEIWVENQNLVEFNERQRTKFRRQKIGFIFQFFNLIPTLTVWENVILPAELKGDKYINIGKEYAKFLLESVGLIDRINTFPDRLSGGEQQRVAIARALVNDPILVLADEPTGNLDDETGNQIIMILDKLTRKAGKNLIMVTHSFEAAAIADRTLHLQNGKLHEENHAND